MPWSGPPRPMFPELFRPRWRPPGLGLPPGIGLPPGLGLPRPRPPVPLVSAASPKNAVVTLNELRPGLEYSLVEERGPVHMPTFVVKVVVNGQAFTGQGR